MELFPDITMIDDSVRSEMIANARKATPDIVKRLVEYGAIAERQGVKAFVSLCSADRYAASNNDLRINC